MSLTLGFNYIKWFARTWDLTDFGFQLWGFQEVMFTKLSEYRISDIKTTPSSVGGTFSKKDET